jgi:hypothetical protein
MEIPGQFSTEIDTSALLPRSSPTRAGLFCAVTIAWVDSEGSRRAPLMPCCRSALNSLSPNALACPAVEPILARGSFSHVHGGAQRMTSMERAFHLARSGRFTTLTEVVTTLDREGYSANQIQGPLLKRQLTVLIKAARPEPLEQRPARKLGATTAIA